MKKRILAIVVALFLVVPGVLQAASANPPDNFIPWNSFINLDIQLPPSIKKLVEPLIIEGLKSIGNESADYKKAQLMAKKFLAGDSFYFNVISEKDILVSFPATSDEFSVLMEGVEGSGNIYSMENMYVAYLNGFVVMAISSEAMNKVIDLAKGTSTNSLANNAEYQSFAGSLLSPRFFGITIDANNLSELIVPLLQGEDAGKMMVDLIKLIKFEGISVAETSAGYKFNIKVTGDEEALRAKNMLFNTTGSFVPNLYKKFPNAKPIFYSESFNLKEGYKQSNDALTKLFESNPSLSQLNIYDSLTKEIEKETGINLEDVVNIFDQEVAFGVQYDNSYPLVYITLMGNVKNNKTAAQKLVADMVNLIEKNTADAPEGAIKITKEDGFTVIKVDIAKVDESYDGPDVPEVAISLGVTEDGLLIISNYPNINDSAKRTGFAGDPDFSAYPEISQISAGITYLNMRNIWGYLDSFVEFTQNTGNTSEDLTLDFYQGYYSFLEKIYGWKDLFLVSKTTAAETDTTGYVSIDNAKHATYKQAISSMKNKDSDKDGTSDFEEFYIYNTPVNSADSNNNGTNDVDELRKGWDPEGEGQFFDDVEETAYYTDEIAMLAQRGCLSEYEDQMFQPGKQMTRAEFTAMVVKCFGYDSSGFFPETSVALGNPFADMKPKAKYYKEIRQAYSKNLLAGMPTNKRGQVIFKPNSKITRAEAIFILNNASSALAEGSGKMKTCKLKGFSDVKKNDRFCKAIASAYASGIATGKSSGEFGALDKLNRADAAVLIKRTLDKDAELMSQDTESTGELTESFMETMMPVSGLLK